MEQASGSEMNDLIEQCDKCNESYPLIIFTCFHCNAQTGSARGYKSDFPDRILCFDCYQKLTEKVWMYDDLCK